jgi:pyruvate dehydrogenase E2 component (dihydrolipoamide acetyltransferase)
VFEDGVLDDWLVEIGTEVPVGTPLASIRRADARPSEGSIVSERTSRDTPQPETMPKSEEKPPQPASAVIKAPVIDAVPQPKIRPRITPSARRLAAEKGVDLTALTVKPGSTITRADVEAMQASVKPEPLSDMRAAIGAAMSRSKREIPHYYLSHRVDLSAADAFVTLANANREPADRLLISALYAKAIARALSKYPEFNGHFLDGQFHQGDTVNLGLATHIRGGGLVAPALFDAQSQTVDALMQAMRDLVMRVRAGRFRARELSDATVTLTSLGDRGVDQLLGVIYPPQVAIIGMGTPRLQPIVHDAKVTTRLGATLTLAADHRVSDGHRGALFLRTIDKLLQAPETL